MKTKDKKKIAKKIFLIIILCLFFGYALIMTYKLVKNPSSTFLVENGKISSEENVIGYIIRDETIIEGNENKNDIVPIKEDGEKVAKGESIYRYSLNNEEDLNAKIKDLDKKIQDAMSKENNLFSSDIKLLENQIEERLSDIYEQNDLQKIKEYKKDINSYITKKAKISGELSPAGSYIKGLIDERSQYEKELNNGAEYIEAPKSGVLSFRIDGLEDILTTSDFSKINKRFLEDLNLKTSQIIGTSDKKGKIIDNFRSFLVCSINSETAKNAKIGQNVKIRLPNSKEVDAEIEYIYLEDNDYVTIVFEIENYVEELIPYRKIAFDIIWWSDSGLKVPNQAIVKNENLSFVIRNRAGYLEKIYVKLLRTNNAYSVVTNYSSEELRELGIEELEIQNRKSISLYDELILNPSEEKINQAK